MKVTWKCFARARELTQKDIIAMNLEHGCTVKEGLQKITECFPSCTSDFLRRCKVAYKNAYISVEEKMEEDGQYTIIPPISGG
jgi:hypothetical protein